MNAKDNSSWKVQTATEEQQAYEVFVRVFSAIVVGISMASLVCAYFLWTKFFYFDFGLKSDIDGYIFVWGRVLIACYFFASFVRGKLLWFRA